MRGLVCAFAVLLAVLCQVTSIDLYAKGVVIVEELYLQLLQLAGDVSVTVTSSISGGDALTPSPPSPEPKASITSSIEKADVLKQPLAKNEQEIDAQQRVSARRYAQMKDMKAVAEEALPLPPDEIRRSMPPLDRHGPEMRCGEFLPTESRLITRNVELHTRSVFQGNFGGSQYVWKYFVTFKNLGEETVQMLTRHWIFVDALGRLTAEVKGPGARGVTPVLPPKGEWTYESGTSLDTPYGSMHGSFQFDLLGGGHGPRSFSARVGRLALSDDGRAKEVPCVDEAKEGMLPLTSVLSVERVILGGRAEFSRKKAGKYYFQYDVQFNNARDSDVDVLSHLWEVVDSKGQRHTVSEGPGVGGAYKHHERPLRAGDAFRVNGEIWSPTRAGNAQGTFRVLIRGEESHEIEARTDFMGLSADKDITHVPNFVSDPNFAGS